MARSISLLIPLAACFIVQAQEKGAADKAAQLQALLKDAPNLPLEKVPVAIQSPAAGWVLGRVSSVTMDRNGVIYVLQRGDKADPVIAVNHAGKVLRSWGKGMFRIPHTIRADAEGNIWTTDAGDSRIIKFTPEGRKIEEFVLGDSPTGKACVFPSAAVNGYIDACGTTDIEFIPDGRLVLTDGYGKMRILLYSSDRKRIREWGGPGTGSSQFNVPHGLAWDGKSILYVADRGNSRIQRFDLEGRYLGEWSNLGMPGAIRFAKGSIWAVTRTLEPAGRKSGEKPSTWVIRVDAATGKLLGKIQTNSNDFIDVSDNGEVLAGVAPNGFLLYRPTK
jgi:DNA-binding beta-propeller fold protein YncE